MSIVGRINSKINTTLIPDNKAKNKNNKLFSRNLILFQKTARYIRISKYQPQDKIHNVRYPLKTYQTHKKENISKMKRNINL